MSDLEQDKLIYILSADNMTIRTLVKILGAAGHKNMRVMDNGIDAMNVMMETPCDFLICDMSIKFIDGWTLIREIKSSEKVQNIPTMLIGKVDSPAEEDELKQYGLVKYLKAPYKESEISFLISSTLLLSKTSGTIEAKYTEAKKALIEKRTDDAVEKYEELNHLTKKSSRSSIGLAEAFLQNDDSEKAMGALSHIKDTSAMTPSMILTKVKIELHQKDFPGANSTASLLLQNKMQDVPFYFVKVLDLFMLEKQHGFCKKICNKGIENKFMVPDFYMALGKITYLEKSFDECLDHLKAVEDQFGPSNQMLNIRGVCLKKMGEFKGAVDAYEQALEICPMDAKIYFNLASCAIAMKDYPQAINYLESCISIDPSMAKARTKIEEITKFLDKVAS